MESEAFISKIFFSHDIEKAKAETSERHSSWFGNEQLKIQFIKALRLRYQEEINKLSSYTPLGIFTTNYSIWLYQSNFIDFISCLVLIEDIFETFPIEHMEQIFNLVEHFLKNVSKKEIEKRKLMILKIMNSVLKRLSSSLNTKLRGKIQMLLSEIFPIAEKSGVNLKGHYNLKNSLPNIGKRHENKFFAQFWILQKFLTNPFLVRLF